VSRRLIGNTIASILAVAVGLFAMWASKTYLRSPTNILDWTVLLFSGFMTGTFVFFLTWGHFQHDPTPDSTS
jgi:hypothetical protein